MTLEELNKNYKYVSDFKNYKRVEHWIEMKPDEDGKYTGDCEDYAITVKNSIAGFQDWNYYYCKLNGVGHCVLSNGDDIIDCNIRRVVSLEEYYKLCNISEFKKYNWFIVFSKMLVGKILSWF